jgi:preprotein translocase subunit SecF
MIDFLKFKTLYFAFSILLLSVSVYFLSVHSLNLGVDFTGGSILEYKFSNKPSTEELTKALEEEGVEVSSIQETQDETLLLKFPVLEKSQVDKVASVSSNISGDSATQLRFENVGPSIGPELIKKTLYAIGVASITILLWVAYQFKSFKYGASAIAAMFHDTLILIGSFSVLGVYASAEIDFLFVTALLTTLSFSVHDTIVVFDRIREIQKVEKSDLYHVANRALSETMVRSLNNSFTIIFMLVALIILGGTTIKYFAIALLIGTILGTYSSPFVATPLLLTLNKLGQKIKRK